MLAAAMALAATVGRPSMSSLRHFLRANRLLPEQFIRLDGELFDHLEALAAAQNRPVRAVVIDALHAAILSTQAQTRNDQRWHTLTRREQQVAALACLGYTNHQIAEMLVISVNTVRSHMRGILDKYRVASKAELRLVLANWDFDTWLESHGPSMPLPTPED